MRLGRKFFGAVILTLTVIVVYFGTLLIYPNAINPSVVQSVIVSLTLMWAAYSGTNVVNKWSKSKYFQKDILEGEEK